MMKNLQYSLVALIVALFLVSPLSQAQNVQLASYTGSNALVFDWKSHELGTDFEVGNIYNNFENFVTLLGLPVKRQMMEKNGGAEYHSFVYQTDFGKKTLVFEDNKAASRCALVIIAPDNYSDFVDTYLNGYLKNFNQCGDDCWIYQGTFETIQVRVSPTNEKVYVYLPEIWTMS